LEITNSKKLSKVISKAVSVLFVLNMLSSTPILQRNVYAATLQTISDVAADVATYVKSPDRDDTKLILPPVPEGYTITIKSSDNPSVLALDGKINPSSTGDITVAITFEITKLSDGSKSVTDKINIAIPQKTVAALYVSPDGNDGAAGTIDHPFKTIAHAKDQVRTLIKSTTGPITVYLRKGTYYLDETLKFTSEDSGNAATPITYAAYSGEEVTISGAKKLDNLNWQVYKGEIMVADVDKNLSFDQLFLNDKRQVLARYPNANPLSTGTTILDGYADDAISPARIAKWKNPVGAFVRGLHGSMWGGNDFIITGVNSDGTAKLQWVGDNNRGNTLHATYRMVENVFEELDAPYEWYLDKENGKLYYYPPSGTDLKNAKFEAPVLDESINIQGTADNKVKFLNFKGIKFTETHRTLFNSTYETLLRGDWAIARKGTVFMQDAENISITKSNFDQVGGNAIFMSGYNRNNTVQDCKITDAGASGVCTVGLTSAVRTPSTWEKHITDMKDTTPGPLTDDYPKDIIIKNNDIYHTGRFEKQTAGVCISMSQGVTVSHNTIHHVPRAGINVNDGTWGGHIVEYNDIYDTVEETGDHGPFNSWGRDRYWAYGGYNSTGINGDIKRQYGELDAMIPTTIRNNRFYAPNGGYGIDLDDGSTNYQIYNNLCLGIGIKLREGFDRKVYNNIMVNGQMAFHVPFINAQDDVQRNIEVTNGDLYGYYQCDSARLDASKDTVDNNVFYNWGNKVAPLDQKVRDKNSIIADPMFTDPANGDYTVKDGSPALTKGFVNFAMDRFGYLDSNWKPGKIVIQRNVSSSGSTTNVPKPDPKPCLGGTITSIYSLDIQSGLGTGDQNGIVFTDVPSTSYAYSQGLRLNDAVLAVNGTKITTQASFWDIYNALLPGAAMHLDAWRNQMPLTLDIKKPSVVSMKTEEIATTITNAPTLPKKVTAILEDGSTQVVTWDTVKWDAVDIAQYSVEGKFTVSGKMVISGLPITANIKVLNPKVLHYDFEDISNGVLDGSPDKANGSIVGTGATLTDGIDGKAIHFDGKTGAKIQDLKTMSLIDNFTIDFWVKPDFLQAGTYIRLFDKMGANNMGILIDANTGGQIRFIGGGVTFKSGTRINVGQWNHVVLEYSYDQNLINLYINGTLDKKTVPPTKVIDQNDLPLVLATDQKGGQTLTGAIDEIKIYNHILSNDATLKSISLNNIDIPNFDPDTTTYNFEFPKGTTTVSTTNVVPNNGQASVKVTKGSAITDPMTVVVTSEDGMSTKTYTVNCTVAQSTVVVPEAPTQLTAIPAGTDKINLNWTASKDATQYNVYRAIAESGSYAKINSTTGSAITYSDTGLTPETDYYYKVTAVNAAGESAMSSGAKATTTAEQKDFIVKSTFNMSNLQANKLLDVQTTVTNNKSSKKSVLAIVALYDENDKMVNMSYISKELVLGSTEKLNSGFKLPDDITGYKVGVFVWDGTSLSNSTMQPLSNVVTMK
jgi:hypothetical protein